MTQWIVQGGIFMYPLLVVAAVIAGLTVWLGVRVRRVTAPEPVLETGIDATLFWGGWALLLGLLGTVGGIYQAAGYISRAEMAIGPAMVWGGIRVALITTLFGLAIFIVSALAWFTLRTVYRRRAAA